MPKEKIKGNSFVLLLLGLGFGLVTYNFLSGNASLENALIGITLFFSIIRKAKEPKDFWYGFLPTFSDKITKETVKSILTGLSVGLLGGVIISCIKTGGSYLPYIIGAAVITISIVLKIISKNKKAGTVAAMIVICLIVGSNVYALTSPATTPKYKTLTAEFEVGNVVIEGVESSDTGQQDYYKGTCKNGIVTFSGTVRRYDGYHFSCPYIALSAIYDDSTEDVKAMNQYDIPMTGDTKEYKFNFSINVTSKVKYVYITITENYDSFKVRGKFDNTDYINYAKDDNTMEKASTQDSIDDEYYDEEHATPEETIAISVVAALISMLCIAQGIGIPPIDASGMSGGETENDYIEVTDPASGAVSGFKRNPETGEYVSLDGNSILDPSKVSEWQKQRMSDKTWTEEQNRKIKENGTEFSRKLDEMKRKSEEEIQKLQEESAKRQKQMRDEKYEDLKQDVTREEKMAKMWQKQGNIFKTAEVSAEVTSIVADSALDIYGHVNPGFAKGYKVIRGGLGGAAEKGWSGLVEGTIKGTADAFLIGNKMGLQNKALVRFTGRVAASAVGSVIRGEDSAKAFNSITNGAIDGLLHAGTGFTMDKLTINSSKFQDGFNNLIKNGDSQNKAIAKTMVELLGPKHGGLQRTAARGVRDFIVKPYVTNPMKANKNKIF